MAEKVVKTFRLPDGKQVKARVDPAWSTDTIKQKLIDKGVVAADTWGAQPKERAVGDDFFAPEVEVGEEQTLADIGKGAAGVGEAVGQMTSGLAGALVGTTSGLRAAMHAPFKGESPGEAFTKTFEQQSQFLTYAPRTEEGQMAAQGMAFPFELAAEGGTNLGEFVYQKTGSPGMATVARVIPEGLVYALPFAGKIPAVKGATRKLLAEEAAREQYNPVAPKAETLHQAEPLQGSPMAQVRDAPQPVTPVTYDMYNKAAVETARKGREQFEAYENYTNDVMARQYDQQVRQPTRQAMEQQGIPFRGEKKVPTDENYQTGIVQPYLPLEEYASFRRSKGVVPDAVLKAEYEAYRAEAVSGGRWYPEGYWDHSPLRGLEDWRVREAQATSQRVVEEGRAWKEQGVADPVEAMAVKNKTLVGRAADVWHSYIGPVFGAEALEVFRKFEKDSPTLTTMLDDLVTPSRGVQRKRRMKDMEQGRVTPAESVSVAKDARMGELMNRVEAIVEAQAPKWFPTVRRTKRAVPKAHNERMWKELTDTELTLEQLSPDARGMRQALDKVYTMLRESGVDTKEYLKGYAPIYLRTKNIRQNRDAFEQMLMEKVPMSSESARRFTENYLNRDGKINSYDDLLVGVNDARRGAADLAAKKTRSEYQRQLLDKIPLEDLKPYMETDFATSMQRYIQEAVERAVFTEKYGPRGEKFGQALQQVQQELGTAGKRLDKAHVERLSGVVNASFRRHEMPKTEVAKALTKAGQVAITAGQTAWLIWSGLMSLSEGALVMRRGGTPKTIKNVVMATTDSMLAGARLVYRDVPKSQVRKLVDDMGKNLNLMAQERMTSLGFGDANAISNAFFHINGQHGMTKWLYNLATRTYMDEIRTFALKEAERTKGSMGVVARLTKDTAHQLRKEELGRVIDLDKLTRWGLKGAKWEDLPFDHQIRVGALRYAEDVVLHRDVARSALWQSSSNPLMRQLGFLSGFPTAIGNKVAKELVRDVVDGTHAALKADDKVGAILKTGAQVWGASELVVTMSTVATGIVLLRRLIRDGDINPKELDEDELTNDVMKEMLRVAGMGGRPQMVLESLGATQRFGGSPIVANLGPAASIAEGFAKAVPRDVASGTTKQTVKQLSRVTPFIGINREVRDRTVEGTTAVLDSVLELHGKKKEGARRRRRRRATRTTR